MAYFFLLLSVPTAVFAFQNVGARHQFGLESNVQGVGTALRTLVGCSALVSHHSGPERVDYAVRSVEYDFRIVLCRSILMCKPI